MKKYIYTIMVAVVISITAFAQVFIIEKKSGNVIELPVDDIVEMSFKVDDNTYDDNTPECVEIVDLGLSVNWASVNLGATISEEPGYLISWGELEEKDWYSWSYYKFGLSSNLAKYNLIDELNILQSEDDAAAMLWGGNWRMPSRENWQELYDNCEVDFAATENGYPGVRFTSKIPGYEDKSIFLCAAGWIQDEYHMSDVALATYWANECVISPSTSMPEFAFAAEFWREGDYANQYYYSGVYRYQGRPIRAVCPNEDYVEPVIPEPLPTFSGNTNIYLNPAEQWMIENAWFATYLNNANTETTAWVRLADDNNDGIYEGMLTDGEWTSISFVQFSNELSEATLDAATNKTGDLFFDGLNNQCNILNVGDDGLFTSEWVLYVEPIVPVEPEYVDLGLSVNWTSCNVGANAPEEYGYYVSWGELEEKDWYSWSYYKFGTSKNTLTKYSTTDNLSILEPEDDIATVIYGSNWRMPSKTEFQELVDYCMVDYVAAENGVTGIRFTSKVPGYEDKSIFFPTAGYKQDDKINNEGSMVSYWINECVVGGFLSLPEYAFTVDFVYNGNFASSTALRPLGRPIRAVCPNEDYVEPVIPEPLPTFSGNTNIYLNPAEQWTIENAWFATYLNNANTETTAWVRLADDNNDGIYEGMLADGEWTSISFVQFSNELSEATLDAATNKTGDLFFDGLNNQCNILNVGDDGLFTSEWVLYVEPIVPVEPEYVDLGLSVNWASCNVGANAPEEYGYYVSWGELEEKDWYSWSYYTHGTKNSLTKYCKTDKLNTLESIDDIATVTFGESWRMPTKSEWQELIDNCTIDYTSQENGVNGLRFTSNVAGYENATIFIPVGGKKQDDGITNEGAYGHYWTSECVSSFGMYYNAFVAELSVLGSVSTANIERCYGCNVRAVIAKEVVVE